VTGQCVPGETCVGTVDDKVCVNSVDACQCPVNVNQFCDRGVCGPIPLRGSPCGEGGVCRRGSYCHPDSGLCTALPDFGEACTADGGCRHNEICDAEGNCTYSPGPVCDDGWCRQYPGVGNPCSSAGTCVSGHCDGGTCAAWPASGEPCTPDGGCSFGSYCDAGLCRVLPGAGESCAPDGSCRYDHQCVLGQCEHLPVQGEPCFVGGTCAEGFACASDSVCYQPPQFWETCENNPLPCPEGAYCSETYGICRQKPMAGGSCEGVGEGDCPAGGPYCRNGRCDGCSAYYSQDVCADGQFCFFGWCSPAFQVGFLNACYGDVNCAANAFCSQRTGRCEALPGPGEACVEGQRLSVDPPYDEPRASCALGLHCRNVEACTGLYGEEPQTDCVCDPDPGEGESCEVHPCTSGLLCVDAVLDGVCEP
jgi:hypothetical protein